jgi:hypothetical protein
MTPGVSLGTVCATSGKGDAAPSSKAAIGGNGRIMILSDDVRSSPAPLYRRLMAMTQLS